MTDENDDVECCMTTGEINAKHVALRGSLAYKYPPKEARCKKECGYLHYVIESPRGRRVVEHPCFLAIGHGRSVSVLVGMQVDSGDDECLIPN